MAMRVELLTALALTLFLLSSPLTAFAQEPNDIPLGKRITAELRSLIESHKDMVKEAVAEIKALKQELQEQKFSIIRQYLDEVKRARDEIKSQIDSLVNQFRAGNISRDDFLSQMYLLKERMKALAKSSEKLGELLSRFSKEASQKMRQTIEELKQANKEFGQSVAETARKIGETARAEALEHGRRAGNATQTGTQRGPPPRNEPPSQHAGSGANATQTHTPPGRRNR